MENFSKPRSFLPPPTHSHPLPKALARSMPPSPDATVPDANPKGWLSIQQRPQPPRPLLTPSRLPAPPPPRAGLTIPIAPCPPLPRPPPPHRACGSGRPGPLPSPHPRLPDPAAPRARSHPGPDCPLCSSLTGPRFGLSGPSGRSRLSVRCRIGGCGPGRGIGRGWLSSASRAASSHGCHLRTPPRPTEPEPRPGPDGSDVTMGQPTPGPGPRSSAHWRVRGEGWGPLPGLRSVGPRGPPATRGGEASSPTWIWALLLGRGSLRGCGGRAGAPLPRQGQGGGGRCGTFPQGKEEDEGQIPMGGGAGSLWATRWGGSWGER